jgi:hypothetical protein
MAETRERQEKGDGKREAGKGSGSSQGSLENTSNLKRESTDKL